VSVNVAIITSLLVKVSFRFTHSNEPDSFHIKIGKKMIVFENAGALKKQNCYLT